VVSRKGKGKCGKCPFALPIDKKNRVGWCPAKEGSKLYEAQKKAMKIGGYVCTGDLSVHSPDEKGRHEDCPMFQKGMRLFG